MIFLPQCKPLHHDQTHETRRLRFVMPHVRLPAPNKPLLCITCHRMVKLSHGYNSLSRSQLFSPCMRSCRAVLCLACCYGKSRASYWLSLCCRAVSFWVRGAIRCMNLPQCRPRNVKPCCYLCPPPDCCRSLVGRGHRNCRDHTEVSMKLGRGKMHRIPNYFSKRYHIILMFQFLFFILDASGAYWHN